MLPARSSIALSGSQHKPSTPLRDVWDPDSVSDDELLAFLLENRGGEPAPTKDSSKDRSKNPRTEGEASPRPLCGPRADSDEAGQAFQYEAGFRAGSDLKPATWRSLRGSWG